MSTIDRGDSHFDDAGGWGEACYHIGVFLHWAARRGLASKNHASQIERLAAAPGAYVVQACDSKLLPDDFSASESLIRTLYGQYLPYYSELVREATGSEYVVGLEPALLKSIDRTLDRALHRLAPERAVRPAPAISADPPSEPNPSPPRRVRHPKFGVGVVLETKVGGGNERMTIEFESVGRKVLLARFVELIDP